MTPYLSYDEQEAADAFFESADWMAYELEYIVARNQAKRMMRLGVAGVVIATLCYIMAYKFLPPLASITTAVLGIVTVASVWSLVVGGYAYVRNDWKYHARRADAIKRICEELEHEYNMLQHN
jgi:hypothetical protein